MHLHDAAAPLLFVVPTTCVTCAMWERCFHAEKKIGNKTSLQILSLYFLKKKKK